MFTVFADVQLVGVDNTVAVALTATAYAIIATALLGCAAFCAYAANIFRRWRQRDQ